jgi:1,4-dihydroxy-2-naphthoyl-CoA synthase
VTDLYAEFTSLELDRPEAWILRITLRDPEKLNAVGDDAHGELAAVWQTVDRDAETRVVVIRGSDGAFSSGGLDANFERAYPAVNENLNAQLRLLWIACGQQDGLIGLNRKAVNWLKSKGMKPTWVETPGGHSFTVWRRYLAELVPSLFQDE